MGTSIGCLKSFANPQQTLASEKEKNVLISKVKSSEKTYSIKFWKVKRLTSGISDAAKDKTS